MIKDSDKASYTVPVERHRLPRDVSTMQKDCISFRPAFEDCGNKNRMKKAPCRGLTTGLLRVCRDTHAQAASIFYSNNKFRFPCPHSAWMQLESFLGTIGATNVAKLRSITVHCPPWHRGMKENFLEGAILNLISPASRFGVVKTSSRDRLLTAVGGSVEAPLRAGRLETFALDLEHGLTTERWADIYSNTRRLIALSEADEHVSRKNEGVRWLRSLSENLLSRPILTVYQQSPKPNMSEYRSRLASVIREADRYGWKFKQHLEILRW